MRLVIRMPVCLRRAVYTYDFGNEPLWTTIKLRGPSRATSNFSRFSRFNKRGYVLRTRIPKCSQYINSLIVLNLQKCSYCKSRSNTWVYTTSYYADTFIISYANGSFVSSHIHPAYGSHPHNLTHITPGTALQRHVATGMGEAGRERVIRMFSFQAFTSQLCSVVKDMVTEAK